MKTLLMVLLASTTFAGTLPDPKLTPGDVLPVTKDQVCQKGYSKSARNVPQRTKNLVLTSYGFNPKKHPKMEVDHLISLELGGSNDQKNLWPELESPRPGFHEKDALENHLHAMVCRGEITLIQAQRMIASDWLSTYNRLIRDHQ